MQTIKIITTLIIISIMTTSCLGDRKAVNVSEINDTSSFVNEDFKGNLINFSKDGSACQNISTADMASMYNVSEDKVEMLDVSKSDRRVPNSNPTCQFYLKLGATDFEWPIGSMSLIPDIEKDSYSAELSMYGENWEEVWALDKSISKSIEWIDDMGRAAYWNESKKDLYVRFKGYTLFISPPRSAVNKVETAKNRDYKSIAINMAKAAGFVN
ncbi:MAG: hypothetical protein WA775_06005 [Psychroserpens sp.]|uniref:hypothetical protein n=1 Tax=Psychroserpens sp. TaxID=2020870 RepID=UPI003C8B4148